mmetsp:Transcript_18442/g.52895  ORF Transcript_18442/g.52895 Transcript_18442/m.52895 type:complete len:332 (-) Transcript_18442:167-1162(-)
MHRWIDRSRSCVIPKVNARTRPVPIIIAMKLFLNILRGQLADDDCLRRCQCDVGVQTSGRVSTTPVLFPKWSTINCTARVEIIPFLEKHPSNTSTTHHTSTQRHQHLNAHIIHTWHRGYEATLLTSSLLLKILHVCGRYRPTDELETAHRADIAAVVLLDEERDRPHPLELDELQLDRVGVLLEIGGRQLEDLRRVHVLHILEAHVAPVDVQLDEGRGLRRVPSGVELGKFDGMDLDELVEFHVQDELLVGVGLAPQPSVADEEVGPGVLGALVPSVALRLVDLVRQVPVLAVVGGGGGGSPGGGPCRTAGHHAWHHHCWSCCWLIACRIV